MDALRLYREPDRGADVPATAPWYTQAQSVYEDRAELRSDARSDVLLERP